MSFIVYQCEYCGGKIHADSEAELVEDGSRCPFCHKILTMKSYRNIR